MPDVFSRFEASDNYPPKTYSAIIVKWVLGVFRDLRVGERNNVRGRFVGRIQIQIQNDTN